MAILNIPVRNDLPAYEFRIILEGSSFYFRFKFNRRRDRWLLDFLDEDKGQVLLGIAMLTDVNIVGRFLHLDIPPGLFLVFDSEGKQLNPGQFDMGDRVKLLYEEESGVVIQ